MFLRVIMICSIAAGGFLGASAVCAASFDCAKASTPMENGICDTTEINRLDGEMGRLYSRLLDELAPGPREHLVREQRAWIDIRNNRCDPSVVGTSEEFRRCMDRLYERRIEHLKAELGEPHQPRYPSHPQQTSVCGGCEAAGPDAAMGCAGYTTRSACVGTEQCKWVVRRCP
ncbi:lysozyme inhibitor LprI family protein [Halochromatium sp.]